MGEKETEDKYVTPRLPTEKNGHFSGEKGESKFFPADDQAKLKMKEYGKEYVEYRGKHPDFTPFTSYNDPQMGSFKGEVDIGHMTTNRHNPSYEYGKRTDGHAIHEDLGNFSQADNELAKSINLQNNGNITGKDVEKFRQAKNLTWHECENGSKMQLIPAEIHKACPHSGGVAEIKSINDVKQNDKTDGIDYELSKKNTMRYTYDSENDRLVDNQKHKSLHETRAQSFKKSLGFSKTENNQKYNGNSSQETKSQSFKRSLDISKKDAVSKTVDKSSDKTRSQSFKESLSISNRDLSKRGRKQSSQDVKHGTQKYQYTNSKT